MPFFPSKEWCEALAAALRSTPDFAQAAQGWKGDFAAVVLAEPPLWNRTFCVYAKPEHGFLERLWTGERVEELPAQYPAYMAQASYSVWKGLILGQIDPVEAVIRKDLEIQGNLQPIIERAQFSKLLKKAIGQVPTEFVKDAPPVSDGKAIFAMDEWKNQTMGWIEKIIEQMLSDDRRAVKVAEAVSVVNRGRSSLEQIQENLVRMLGIASKREVREIGNRAASLKRRLKNLSETISR